MYTRAERKGLFLARIYLFEECELNLGRYELRRSGKTVKLEKQPLDILILLLERPGELVSREEIRSRVWSEDVFLDADQGINNGIRKIRLALGDDSEEPRYIETVVGRGYRFKAKVTCLPAPPGDFQPEGHAELAPIPPDIPPEVEQQRLRTSPPKIPTTPSYWRTLWVFALVSLPVAVLLAALVLNVGGLHQRIANVKPPPVSAVKLRRSVAVLGFKNLSQRSQAAWLSTALADMLTTELAAGGQLRMVSGENIARAKRDLSLSDTDSYAPDTLLRLRKNLGTDLIITGSYSDPGGAGNPLRLDLRIQNAATGEMKLVVSATGTKRDLFQLVSHAGSDLRENLGIGEIAAMDLASVQSAYPSKPEAARWYAQGQEKLRLDDALGAKALLEKAISADPRSPLAHSALAIAWSALGYDAKAADEGKTAFELSGNLSREERMLIEARYREVTKQWSPAAAIYATLFAFFPDDADYGLSLVRMYNREGKGKEAQNTVSSLRSSGAIAPDDPRLILADAASESVVGNLPLSMQLANESALKAAAQGARFQLAKARAFEGGARWRVGDGKRAIELLTEAKEIYSAVGNKLGEAQALHDIGTSLFIQGDLPGAQRTLGQAAFIRREIGEKYGLSRTVNNLGAIQQMQGDLKGAREMFTESLALSREVNNKNTISASLTNLGTVLSQQGEYGSAEKVLRESIKIAREISDKQALSDDLLNLANVRLMAGDLVSAKARAEESFSIAQRIGMKGNSAYSLATLGDVAAAHGDIAEGRKKYGDSLALWTATNEKIQAAQTRLAEAMLSFEQGELPQAEGPIRDAIEEFRKNKMANDEIFARAMLARVLVSERKPADARAEVNIANQLGAKSQDRSVQLVLVIAVASVLTAEGHAAEAGKILAAKLNETKDRARLDLRYQARLVIAEIEASTGKTSIAGNHLVSLQQDASGKGFLLIAKEALKERSSCCAMASQSMFAKDSSVQK